MTWHRLISCCASRRHLHVLGHLHVLADALRWRKRAPVLAWTARNPAQVVRSSVGDGWRGRRVGVTMPFMRLTTVSIVFGAALVAASFSSVRAQQPANRTVLDGVYSAAQAKRGEAL